VANRVTVAVQKDGYMFFPLAAPYEAKKGYVVGFEMNGEVRVAWRPALSWEGKCN
jgi:hypothetical protein